MGKVDNLSEVQTKNRAGMVEVLRNFVKQAIPRVSTKKKFFENLKKLYIWYQK